MEKGQNLNNYVSKQTMDIERFIKGTVCLQWSISFLWQLIHCGLFCISSGQMIVKKGNIEVLNSINRHYNKVIKIGPAWHKKRVNR